MWRTSRARLCNHSGKRLVYYSTVHPLLHLNKTFMKKFFAVAALAFGLTLASGTVNEAAAQTNHKKKDAIIGGVAGAATGAIVSKKKGKGALIGGAAGAGAGYLIGRQKEKKEAKKQ